MPKGKDDVTRVRVSTPNANGRWRHAKIPKNINEQRISQCKGTDGAKPQRWTTIKIFSMYIPVCINNQQNKRENNGKKKNKKKKNKEQNKKTKQIKHKKQNNTRQKKQKEET